jgi:hypothetical protein
MKAPTLLMTLLFCAGLAGCASNVPPPPEPFLGIADARKLGDGAPEQSAYAIVVRYENAIPGKHEVKIGFGYNPSDEALRAMVADAQNVYAIAHSEVVAQASGDIRVTLEPETVRKQGGTLNGRIHAILSPHPHGKEWVVQKHDIFVLPPDRRP